MKLACVIDFGQSRGRWFWPALLLRRLVLVLGRVLVLVLVLVLVHLRTSCQYLEPATTATLVWGNFDPRTHSNSGGDVNATSPLGSPRTRKMGEAPLMLSGTSAANGYCTSQ